MELLKDENGIFVDNSFNISTKKIQNFYENNPFPNYEGKENKMSLIDHFSKNEYLKNLIEGVGFRKKILEVGSGTSQLSNLIALMTNNDVVAFDATYNALKMGKKFSSENNINNIKFVNGDIANIDKIFDLNEFDFVICSGVLHHTSEPYENFIKISKILKNNGKIIIGLYNKYGRIYSKILKLLYKSSGEWVLKKFDSVLKNQKHSKEQTQSWIRDQYIHPLESTHSFDEVFEWFKNANINVISTIPNLNEIDYRFQTNINFIPRIIIQFFMNFTNHGRDGGLFIVEGKKNDQSNS